MAMEWLGGLRLAAIDQFFIQSSLVLVNSIRPLQLKSCTTGLTIRSAKWASGGKQAIIKTAAANSRVGGIQVSGD